MRKLLLAVLVLLALPPLARPQASQSIIRWVESGGTIRTVGETAATALPVNIVASIAIGGGTQYTEGDVDTTITGTAAMMEVAGNVLQPIQGTVADGLLVNLGGNNDVTVTGSVTANAGTNLNTSLLALETGGNLAGAAASLSVMDDWDETNRAAVNLIAGQVGVTGGTGTDSALTLRMSLATNVALPAGTNLLGKIDHNATGVGHGIKTIAAAGTDEALAGSTVAKYLTVQAQTDNTGWCAIGATGVDATIATGTGVMLAPGDSYSFNIDNLADTFLDCTVTGDGVRYTYQN
jgi:hypothetical protein